MQTLKIYIHIGSHKTGSTFLQNAVFTHIQETSHFYLHNSSPFYTLLNQSLQNLPSVLKRDQEALIKEVRNALMLLLPDTCTHLILSDEGIIGSLNNSYQDAYIRAVNLKAIFPEAEILIFIRRQDSFLESSYQQTVKEGCSIPLKKYLGIKRDGNHYLPQHYIYTLAKFEAYKLNWMGLIDTYSDIFGASQLHVFAFETLKTAPERIFSRLESIFQCHFKQINCDKKYNPSLSFLSFWLCFYSNLTLRIVTNRFALFSRLSLPANKTGFLYRYIRKISNVIRFPGPFILLDRYLSLPSYSRFPTDLKQQIFYWHREQNKQLAEKYHLALKEYGYY